MTPEPRTVGQSPHTIKGRLPLGSVTLDSPRGPVELQVLVSGRQEGRVTRKVMGRVLGGRD